VKIRVHASQVAAIVLLAIALALFLFSPYP
jgi:hypothetical protein